MEVGIESVFPLERGDAGQVIADFKGELLVELDELRRFGTGEPKADPSHRRTWPTLLGYRREHRYILALLIAPGRRPLQPAGEPADTPSIFFSD